MTKHVSAEAVHSQAALSCATVGYSRSGSGPTLVFLDGAACFRPDGPFVGSLPARFDVIVPDFPGFGRSELPAWMSSVDDFAHTFLELFDKLNLEDIILVGTSFGAWVAAEIATRNSDRLKSLILASPLGVKVGPNDQLDLPDVFAMSREALEKLVYRDVDRFGFKTADKSDAQLKAMAQSWETFALVSWDTYLHNPKLRYRLPSVKLPTLVLRGDCDGLLSRSYVEKFVALLPSANLITLSESGHLPHLENPEQFAAAVGSFAGR